MDEAERREFALSRLWELYEASAADLDRRILQRDSAYSPTDVDSSWPQPFSRESFLAYLNGPVRDSDIRDRLVMRLLLFASEEEREPLRQALREIVPQSIRLDGTLESPSSPHFLGASPIKSRKCP
jgi:hypothetical protein